MPTLVLSGADTWEPMPTTTHTLAATIPAARHVVWPGQSHFATMTAPALVADALRQFFAEISAAQPSRDPDADVTATGDPPTGARWWAITID